MTTFSVSPSLTGAATMTFFAPAARKSDNSPTVFNYYSPDYQIPGTTLLGPEFSLMTTGTAIARAKLFRGENTA